MSHEISGSGALIHKNNIYSAATESRVGRTFEFIPFKHDTTRKILTDFLSKLFRAFPALI